MSATLLWSWKLVRVAGIHVYIHGTFFPLVGFMAVNDLMGGQGVTTMVRGTMLILAVFSTVVLHEFGLWGELVNCWHSKRPGAGPALRAP